MPHSQTIDGLDRNLFVSSIVREVLSELNRSRSVRQNRTADSDFGGEERPRENRRKSKKKSKKASGSKTKIIKALLEAEEQRKKNPEEFSIPPNISVLNESFNASRLTERSESSNSLLTTSSNTVGTADFYKNIAKKLAPHRNSICIQEDLETLVKNAEEEKRTCSASKSADGEFQAAFAPEDMRCLALVSHNEMKSTMKEFVESHKQVLKKFRLTGTSSTMALLEEVFRDEPDIVFGPTCSSGPLGGDAELVTLMVTGQLGGILFFQDPMTAHPHQADIDCLNRQAQVHNTVIATTPTTAMALTQVFRMALEGEGKPELLPSFFFSLQGPSVAAYKKEQMVKVSSLASLSRLTVSTSGTDSN